MALLTPLDLYAQRPLAIGGSISLTRKAAKAESGGAISSLNRKNVAFRKQNTGNLSSRLRNAAFRALLRYRSLNKASRSLCCWVVLYDLLTPKTRAMGRGGSALPR